MLFYASMFFGGRQIAGNSELAYRKGYCEGKSALVDVGALTADWTLPLRRGCEKRNRSLEKRRGGEVPTEWPCSRVDLV